MYNLFSPVFLLFFLYSFIAIFLAIYIPGSVLLRLSKSKLPFFSNSVLAIVVGISLWVFQGFLLGFLNLRFLSYLYIVVFIIFWVRNFKFRPINIKFNRVIVGALALIVIGVLSQNIAAFFMGTQSAQGISFCCVDASDGLYFASLSQEIKFHIPPQEPGLSGVIVKNYHYLSNIFVAELSRIFFIPINIIQFQISALFLSTMLGATVLSFGLYITKKWKYALWLVFFVYFGGDFIWLLLLFLNKGVNPFVMSSLEDGVKFLSNPPRAFAIVQFFGGLTLLAYWLKEKKSLLTTVILGLIFGTLVGFKVYLGIFAVSGLISICLFQLYKKEFEALKLLLVTGIVALVLYVPVNSGAGGIYFTGFWAFENFISQPYLQLGKLELARRIFLDDGKIFKSYFFELIFILVTVFSFFGSKLLGIIQTKKSLSHLPFQLHIFLLTGLILSFVLGFFFQQTSGGSNTFNFIVNVFIIGSIYTALTVDYFTSFKKPVAIVLAIIVIAVTIPRVWYETSRNISRLTNNQYQTITPKQLEGFDFLKGQKKGLTVIDRTVFGLDASSPYIKFFVEQPMYLSGTQILESHGVNVKNKVNNVSIILDPLREKEAQQLLQQEDIMYLVIGKTSPIATVSARFSKSIFSNNEVSVLLIAQP